MPRLQDRTIIVTGGASGIGRATAELLSEHGARVLVNDLDADVAEHAANEIEGDGDDLRLRFSFALVVQGVEGGSAREQEYADSMTGDYLKAVAATLNAMRRIAEGASAVSA
jgi:NAD(P)-dependent dehydrogenase (short-subunit alcohol dehydrogenase family)